MVQLINTTDSKSTITERRHVDPPKLWLGVLTGSIAAHLLLFWVTLPLTARLSPSQPETASIPIDLVEITPDTSPSSPQAEPTATIATPAPATTLPPSSTANQGAVDLAPSTPTTASRSRANPTPETDSGVGRSRTTQPAPTPPPVRPGTPPPSPSRNPTPAPDAPVPTPPTAPGSDSTPPTSTDPGGSSSESASTDSSTEPATPTPNPDATDPGLPVVRVGNDAVPAQLTASVRVTSVPAAENPRDIPDNMATPTVDSQTFISDPANSSCVVEPEAVRYLGQTVALRVTVDETGRVSHTEPRIPRQDSAYEQLAACLVADWQFNPATTEGVPVNSDYSIVSITIDRVQ